MTRSQRERPIACLLILRSSRPWDESAPNEMNFSWKLSEYSPLCVWNSGRALSSWDWAHLLLFCLRCRLKESDQKSQCRAQQREDT